MIAVKALSPLWPGVVWSPLSHVSVKELPDTPLPAPDWIRVRNIQCGICPTDTTLLYLDLDLNTAPVPLPGTDRFYLGHEVVSEVVEVGPEVKKFRVGDRVVMGSRFSGANCFTQGIDPLCRHCAQGQERLCENGSLMLGSEGIGGGWGDGYTAHETEVWRVPEGIDDDQATLIEPIAVGLHGVLRRPPEQGDQVLVIGAGIVGLSAIQAVKIVQPDCQLTVVARYPHQIDAARRLGADEVVAEGDLYHELARIADAKHYTYILNRGMLLGGIDVIYDCVGSRDTLIDSLRWARAGGTVVLIGLTLSFVKIDVSPVWHQEVDLQGSLTFGMETWRGRKIHTFDLVIEMFLEGILRHEGLITQRFPFERFREAIDVALDKRTGSIKVVFEYQ
jgi:threonine dehydrogenase-like Zn-dependent dehydrogenase